MWLNIDDTGEAMTHSKQKKKVLLTFWEDFGLESLPKKQIFQIIKCLQKVLRIYLFLFFYNSAFGAKWAEQNAKEQVYKKRTRCVFV